MISTKEAFIDAKEVSQILGVGMTKAYAVIKAYNSELDTQGYFTMRGKCPRKYFEQKIYGYADYYDPGDDLTRKAGIVAEKRYGFSGKYGDHYRNSGIYLLLQRIQKFVHFSSTQ